MTRDSRRGSVYVLVLGVTTLVMTIGVGAALCARASLEDQRTAEDMLAADAAARSGLELTLATLNALPSSLPSATRDTLTLPTTLGEFTISVAISDPDGVSPLGVAGQRTKLIALAQRGTTRQLRSIIIEPVVDREGGEPYFTMIPGSYRIEVE